MSKGVEEILKDRQEEYGDAKDSFIRIGRGWGAILGIPDIDGVNVALMMDFLKTIRLAKNHTSTDSWLDKRGYSEHGEGIANEHQK